MAAEMSPANAAQKKAPEDSGDKVEQLETAATEIQQILQGLVQQLKQQRYDASEFNRHTLIPEVIARYRLEHGMNQGDLALLAGVTPNTMAKLNKDHSSMRVATLLNILQALGLTLYVGPIDG